MTDTVIRIKICGITNSEDARAAVDYGADALGFIFVPESPRYVGGDERLDVVWESAPLVSKVAVCLDATDLPGRFEGTFNAIQFYKPQADQTWHWSGGHSRIYAARMRDEASLEEIETAVAHLSRADGKLLIDALLLDTYHKDKLGGSGETFNWDLALEAKRRFGLPIILAGGLTPDNVADAVRTVQPYAIDVSSGVEASPGRKDHAKLRKFIRAVRKG